MAFWKDYPNRKDWRKPSRCVVRSCMSHGGCPWCDGNRFHRLRVADEKAKDEIKEFETERC